MLQLNLPSATEWMIHPDYLPNESQAMGFRERVIRRHGISDAPDVSNQDGVAVVRVDGPLTRRANFWQLFYDGQSSEGLADSINSLAKDNNVRAIVLHTDTPGGEAMGMPELSEAVKNAAKKKPVIVQVDGLLASGGYYLAAHATKIYASSVDNYVGSIGTLLMFYDYSQRFEQMGVKPVIIATGEYKATGAVGAPVSESQIAYLEDRVKRIHSRFERTVMNGRGLSREQMDLVGDGRVFDANQAVKLGLIDGVQSLDKTLRELARQSQPQGGAKVSDTNQTATAATMEDLQLLPGVTNDFIVESLKNKWTADQASSTWMERQQAAIEASQKSLAESEKQREELALRITPGNLSEDDKQLGDQTPGGTGDEEPHGSAIERWESAIAEKVKTGLDRRQAVRDVTNENPELHEQYLEEYREKFPPASQQIRQGRAGSIR